MMIFIRILFFLLLILIVTGKPVKITNRRQASQPYHITIPIVESTSSLYGPEAFCGSVKRLTEGDIFFFKNSQSSNKYARTAYWPFSNQNPNQYPPISPIAGPPISNPYYYPYPFNYLRPRPNQHIRPRICTWRFEAASSCQLVANFEHFEGGDLNCNRQYLLLADEERELQICGFAIFPAYFKSLGKLILIKHFRKPQTWNAEFEGYVTCVKNRRPSEIIEYGPTSYEIPSTNNEQEVSNRSGDVDTKPYVSTVTVYEEYEVNVGTNETTNSSIYTSSEEVGEEPWLVIGGDYYPPVLYPPTPSNSSNVTYIPKFEYPNVTYVVSEHIEYPNVTYVSEESEYPNVTYVSEEIEYPNVTDVSEVYESEVYGSKVYESEAYASEVYASEVYASEVYASEEVEYPNVTDVTEVYPPVEYYGYILPPEETYTSTTPKNISEYHQNYFYLSVKHKEKEYGPIQNEEVNINTIEHEENKTTAEGSSILDDGSAEYGYLLEPEYTTLVPNSIENTEYPSYSKPRRIVIEILEAIPKYEKFNTGEEESNSVRKQLVSNYEFGYPVPLTSNYGPTDAELPSSSTPLEDNIYKVVSEIGSYSTLDENYENSKKFIQTPSQPQPSTDSAYYELPKYYTKPKPEPKLNIGQSGVTIRDAGNNDLDFVAAGVAASG